MKRFCDFMTFSAEIDTNQNMNFKDIISDLVVKKQEKYIYSKHSYNIVHTYNFIHLIFIYFIVVNMTMNIFRIIHLCIRLFI